MPNYPPAEAQPDRPTAKPGWTKVIVKRSRSLLPKTRKAFLSLVAIVVGCVLLHQGIGERMTASTSIETAAPEAATLVQKPDERRSLPPSSPIEVPYFGHRPHAEANAKGLTVIASYSQDVEQRFERLQSPAGLALMQMLDAARLDGVWLVPISGFRDLHRQGMLFQLQIRQSGTAAAAAKIVAPPGYSEHHTGFAIDLADGLARVRDLDLSFGQTEAFNWLTRRAQEFGFELSFPQDNRQGVSYEPWHWRYVGSAAARQIFNQPLDK